MAGADTSREDDELEDAKAEFARANEAWSENYNRALEDFRFARLGEQWPEKVRKQRDLEGRPCLTINKLPAFIRQVVNDARQNKPSITVHPVDDESDPETAEVYDGLIRHIEQSSDADVAYDTAIDHSATGGFGFFKINTRYATEDGFEQDIVIEPVSNAFSIIPDPDTTAADSSDWNIAFEVENMRRSAFERRWKDAEAVSFDANGLARKSGAAGDSDNIQIAYQWVRTETKRRILALRPTRPLTDEERAQIGQALPESMIIEEAVYKAQKELFDALGYEVVGQPRDVPSHSVEQRILSGANVLETNPWAGKWIPIVPVYGEDLNIEGQRHLSGLVRSAMDAQRQFNYWRTTSTELVALAPKAPFIGRVGMFETDQAKWATANTQSHAYIEYDVPEGQSDAVGPQRQPFAGVPAGALQEALNASDDMKAILGLYDASLGARSNETSGRAIMARQREGDVGTFHYIDNLSRSIRHAGRILLDLIPKVYATPRVARILGPNGDVATVRVAPKSMAEQEQAKQPEGMEEAAEVARIYSLDVGKYDLTVTAGPSFTSRREEAANQMIEFIRAYPQAAPLIGDLLAKNLDWPGADEVAERLKAMLPAQLQGESPEAEAAKAQIQKMAQVIGQLKGENEALKADKSVEGRKVEIDAYNAETNRLKAVIPKGASYDPAAMEAVISQSLAQLFNSPDILEAAGQGAPPEQLAAMLAQRMGSPAGDDQGGPTPAMAA
jgi:hypothetical protein